MAVEGCGAPLLLVIASTAASCGPAPPPPNVILISIDTLRQDHVGHYGYARDTTPNLDALAEESLVFDRAYAAWSWTLISHMTLLTGLYPSQHGVVHRTASLPKTARTLAERLRDEGYYTTGFYFPGWLDPNYGFGRGFDVYESHQDAAEAGAHIRSALAGRPTDRPLFLFVNLFDVHNSPLRQGAAPYQRAPKPFDEHFLPGAHALFTDLDAKKLWEEDGSIVSEEQHEAIVALYDGGIRYVDHVLGEWFETWKREGLLDGALLIVTSDHGEGLFQHGRAYEGHGGSYEEGLVVPLMIRFPDGRFAGEHIEDPVSHTDLVPTILELLDLAPDADLPGYSLLDRPSDAFILAEHPRVNLEVLIGWPKKVLRERGSSSVTLTDLQVDPLELASRRRDADRPGFLSTLLERVASERETWTRFEAHERDPLDENVENLLRSLGYAGEEDD